MCTGQESMAVASYDEVNVFCMTGDSAVLIWVCDVFVVSEVGQGYYEFGAIVLEFPGDCFRVIQRQGIFHILAGDWCDEALQSCSEAEESDFVSSGFDDC